MLRREEERRERNREAARQCRVRAKNVSAFEYTVKGQKDRKPPRFHSYRLSQSSYDIGISFIVFLLKLARSSTLQLMCSLSAKESLFQDTERLRGKIKKMSLHMYKLQRVSESGLLLKFV